MIYPVFSGFVMSLYRTGLNSVRFVGIQNYIRLFSNKIFIKSTINTIEYVLGVGLLTVVGGLFISTAVFDKSVKYMSFIRGCCYVPVMMTMVAYSIVWLWILNPAYGLINHYISIAGGERINFIGIVKYAKPILIVVIWLFNLGQAVILFIAAMIGIPQTLLEAARIDGASKFQSICKIVLPLVKPTIFYVIILIFIDVIKVYLAINLMTAGGPNYETMSLMYLSYDEAFVRYNLGNASAIGVIMFILSLILSLTQFKLFRVGKEE
jgi:multiple sugar transport system permease protein